MTEQTTEQSTVQTTEPTTEQATEQRAEQNQEQAAEQTAGPISGRLVLMLMFPGLAGQVPAVRGYVRAVFREHPRLEDLLLVLTELLGNALRHTRRGGPDGMVTVTVLDTGTAARLEVIDQGGDTRPELRTDPASEIEGESGYGLELVSFLASAWDAVPWGEGTKTWFEI